MAISMQASISSRSFRRCPGPRDDRPRNGRRCLRLFETWVRRIEPSGVAAPGRDWGFSPFRARMPAEERPLEEKKLKSQAKRLQSREKSLQTPRKRLQA